MKEVRGVVLPSPTVFREDGRVDEPLMRELTEWFVASGVQAFFILGSYGQGAAMHPEERKNVAEIDCPTSEASGAGGGAYRRGRSLYRHRSRASMPRRSVPRPSAMSGLTITLTARSMRLSSILKWSIAPLACPC